MIVKIPAYQAEILKYACAVLELECNIFTIENNPLLVQAEVMHEGEREISTECAWHLNSILTVRTAEGIKSKSL